MMRKRAATAMAAVAVLVSGLAACSAGAEAGPVTITLLEYQQTRAEVVEELIPEFEAAMAAEGKDVKVELITDELTDSQFKTKITQQLHSGTAPDVIDIGGSHVTGLAGAGYLLQLDEYLESWPGWAEYYAPVKAQAEQPDGHFYSLPHEAGVQSLFYRKDVLEQLGVDTSQPQTWDELIERLKVITAATGQPSILLPAGTAWGGGTWSEGFLPIVAGTGSTFYDGAAGKWTVTSEGLSATFDLYHELTTAGLLPVQDLLNPNPWEPTKYVDFPEGTLPVVAQGTWGWRYDWGPRGGRTDRGRAGQGRHVGLPGAGAGHGAVLGERRRLLLRGERGDGARRRRGRARPVAELGQRARAAARRGRCGGTALRDLRPRALQRRAEPPRRRGEAHDEHRRSGG
ncbi:ABC transporter substrate-binding protein [Pseudonocardia sp. MH-G8]|uniref:ABC transporter substrate-binding protein n=1 Tax=Pseudonocardia sp. MH-G8 TaxID=1854588 RepID=UPI001E288CDE|nr:extracellular solute-binding protein [Pseudonocardia sp. MH-G8]